MAYLLDANVFITAKNLHYGFDFCPAFWDWLDERRGEGISIEPVRDELLAGEDDLAEWARDRDEGLFLPLDQAVLAALARVSEWVQQQEYLEAAKAQFFQSADFYLIGAALAWRRTVVSHERASSTTKRVKIPDVCIGLGIRVINPFVMLRIERARFVLAPRAPAPHAATSGLP
ncbi:MAG TPA: DUF4411 family protein [Thermoanaerobaculia bacterium]|nr:DUF4411 family protein [Thermoanaerobaculia bacterium]